MTEREMGAIDAQYQDDNHTQRTIVKSINRSKTVVTNYLKKKKKVNEKKTV